MKTSKILLSSLLLIVMIGGVSAIQSNSIGATCRILDSSDVAVSGANVTVLMYTAASGGTPIYNETFVNATDSNGYCTFGNIGDSSDVSIVEGTTYYLDLEVNGDDYDFNGTERSVFKAWWGQSKSVTEVNATTFYQGGNAVLDDTSSLSGDKLTGSISITEANATTINQNGNAVLDDTTGLLNTGDTATGNYSFDSNTLFIDSTNNRLGIGTGLPSYQLDVVGNASFSEQVFLGNAATASTHAVRADRTITAGTGLTGGGSLVSDRTLSVDGVLQDLDTLGVVASDGQIIVGTGSGTFAYESGATARTSLGLSIGSDVQAYDADLDTYAGITPSANIQSFLGSADYSTARSNLGVAIGSDVQAWDADLDTLGGLASTDNNFIVGSATGWVVESGSTVRTSLGLGDLATQSTINNDDWSGTDLAVVNGGTGSSTASAARTALGLAIGSDVQAFGAVLDDLNTLGAATTDGEFIVATGAGVFAYESGSTARSSLGVAIGSDVQAHSAVLDDFNTLGTVSADSEFIVGAGSGTFAYENASTARTSLGLGDLATQSSVNNDDWSGTDLAIGNGGTGASDAGTARTNLGVAIGSDVQAYGAVLDDFNTLGTVASDGQIIVGTGAGVFAYESGSTARTSLGLSIGSDVQAWDTELDDIAGLSDADSNFIVGSASGWVAESGSTARTSLGLGSLATQDSDNVSITGGVIGGLSSINITDSDGSTTVIGENTISPTEKGISIDLGDSGSSSDTYFQLLESGSPIFSVSYNDYMGPDGDVSASNLDASFNSLSLSDDLAVSNGGTGASDAASARSNLGVAASGANTDITSATGLTGELRTSSFINQTLSDGNVRYFSNGCVEKVNSTGVYVIC